MKAKKSKKSFQESLDSETKSSAGDKYETGRAMVQIELEKNQAQYNKFLKLKNELKQIDPIVIKSKIEYGSIVVTNNGNFFFR